MLNKNDIINTLIKEIIPSSIKKVKPNVAQIQKEIPQNTNKIYSDIKQISFENIIANYIPTEHIAPFAKRIINPTEFNQKTGLVKTFEKIQKTKVKLSNIKDAEIKTSFEYLYKKIINETSNIEQLSDEIINLSQKIGLIENQETKKLLLSEIHKLLKLNKKDFKSNFSSKIVFIEDATDAVNIMNNKYLNTKSEPIELYNWLKSHNSWFTDAIEGNQGTINNYRNKFATKKSKIDYESYLKNLNELKKEKLPNTFQNNLKLEAFQNFIYEYNDIEPKFVKQIYNIEFLKSQPRKIRNILKNINKTFDTFVIPFNAKFSINDAKYLEEELTLWKKAGLGKSIQPKIININYLDKTLNQNNYSGIAYSIPKEITVLDLLDLDCNINNRSITLRHEINHLNDKTIHHMNNGEKLFKFLKWNINKLIYKKQWITELKNAGVSDFSANYAMKNQHELKSVTSESLMEYLSNKFKN